LGLSWAPSPAEDGSTLSLRFPIIEKTAPTAFYLSLRAIAAIAAVVVVVYLFIVSASALHVPCCTLLFSVLRPGQPRAPALVP
jgi:hypothetical protein